MKRFGNAALVPDIHRNGTGLLLSENSQEKDFSNFLGTAGRPIRGREVELERVSGVLDETASGRGAVLLVEGVRGSGRSRLLAETSRMATDRGFDVVSAEANELMRLIPLAPLFAALGEPQPAHGESEHAFDGSDDRWSSQLGHLRGRLVRRAAERPLLVVLDDLQWTDRISLLALRLLPTQLAGYPIGWVLSRCTDEPAPRVSRLYDQLLSSGVATSLELGPLCPPAAEELVADLLGAAPSPEVNALVGAADGNPAVLTELFEGLVDEGTVVGANGTARLVNRGATPLPPQRFRTLVRARIAALSPVTARMLEVAAVLGRSWFPDDVVEMLGTSTAELLLSFQEALDARLLVSTSDTMAFRHDLVWRSISDSIAPPVRAALHRQAARMLLDKGAPIVSVAVHLAHGARPQDVAAVRVLKDGASEVMASSPRTAVELASRGLELTDREEPVRLELTAVLVEALTRIGALGRATGLAREALSQATTASLGLWLSTALLLTGDAGEALAVSDRAIEDRSATAETRGVLRLNRLAARAALGTDTLDDTAVGCADDQVGVLTVLATARWRHGRFAEGLQLARDAVRAAADGARFPWHLDPRIVLAALLIQSRHEDEAKSALATLETHVAQAGLDVLAAVPHLLRAQAHLAAGRLDEARSRAQAALAEPATLYTPIAYAVLTAVALRRGDLVTADEHVRKLGSGCTGLWLEQARWLRAQVTGELGEELPGPAVLVEEPAAAAWYVRSALAAGNADRAAALVRRLAEAGGCPAVDHARGVHDRDRVALERAARRHVDVWSHASAAEDLAVLLAPGERAAAIERLDEALAAYRAAGAERDAARVRRRLRGLGVRRRHWRNADRPASGWDSLTETERNVATLVLQGLTNKQVAAQMFLSPHTVGFHLRQIFRKLGIHSRTELTRFDPHVGRTR
nr:RebR-like transcriptional regulator [uncultured bacterium]